MISQNKLNWFQRSASSYFTVMVIPHHDGKALSFRFSHLMVHFLILLFLVVVGFSFFSFYEQIRFENLAHSIERKERNNIIIMAEYHKRFNQLNKTMEGLENANNGVLQVLNNGKEVKRNYYPQKQYSAKDEKTEKLKNVLEDASAYNKFIAACKDTFRNSPTGWPVSGRITSYYGYRIHPIFRSYHFHRGIDIGAPSGSPVYATANGTVQKAGSHNAYGKYVLIRHKFGYSTLYGHNSRLLVRGPGQKVRKGQVIARIGNTGISTGPHIHYEVRSGNYSLNPIRYMSRWF